MARTPIQLTDAEREAVLSEIYAYPDGRVRRKMRVIRGVDSGLTRETAGRVAGVALNPIERFWGFAKRQSLYGKYHPDTASFRAAIEEALDGISTAHTDKLKTLMALKFQ